MVVWPCGRPHEGTTEGLDPASGSVEHWFSRGARESHLGGCLTYGRPEILAYSVWSEAQALVCLVLGVT